MMLRVSLRRRELLGARMPIFPSVTVPVIETGERMERLRHGKRTREAQEGQNGLVAPRHSLVAGCRAISGHRVGGA